MRSRITIAVSGICIAILLQTTILEYITINNIKPNLMLIFIVSIALLRGNIEGAVTGFFGGLMQDIVSGKVIGFYALLGMYLGLVVGSLNKRIYRDNVFVALFFSFCASVAYETLVYLLGIFLKGHTDFLYSFTNKIIPEALYNTAVTIILFYIVVRLDRRFNRTKKSLRKY
ncbi:MAG TPA: rod shape-determining protein MreD [Pseudobacteroides sp.]|uniref:rod shape-determining protein MreD n=1 Tax=Pseudobacteroides sp. TaxID=1968840 RepID=UPI002F91D2EE